MALLLVLGCLLPRDVRLHLLYCFPLGFVALHCTRRLAVDCALGFAIACQLLTSLYLGLSTPALLVDTMVFGVMALFIVSFARAARKSHLHVLELATFDALTGLLNRRSFESRLVAELNRQKRYGGCFSLAMLDLDKFKTLNDSQGHKAGDAALRLAAHLISRCSRNTDAVFRLGGDEFSILMPNTGRAHAVSHCELICQSIQRNMVEAGFPVTSSIGVASFEQAPESMDHAVLQADTAMYTAKAKLLGRGCVVGV